MSRFWIATFAVLWLCGIGMGLHSMASYESTPGVAANPAVKFPYSQLIKVRRTQPVLMMFVHPRCPCTRASLAELGRIALRCPNKAQISVLFFVPHDAAPHWFETELWQRAAEIPGVTMLQDRDGAEAKRLHVETSGESLLYDADGKLLFHGGITAQRGHEGDNAGRAAIEALLNHEKGGLSQTPVFGCSLHHASFTTQGGMPQCRR